MVTSFPTISPGEAWDSGPGKASDLMNLITGAINALETAGSGLQARDSAAATTSSLAAGAADSATVIALAVGYRLYSITTDRPARVRLYETAAQQAADLARAIGTDPTGSAGVVLDYVTVAGGTAYTLSPLVDGASLESVPSANIAMTVTNKDVSTGTVTVTLTWVRTE